MVQQETGRSLRPLWTLESRTLPRLTNFKVWQPKNRNRCTHSALAKPRLRQRDVIDIMFAHRPSGLGNLTKHPVATVELFVELDRIGYDGVIYFDTFPDHSGLDPVEEARTNVALVDHLRRVAEELGESGALADAISRQDATRSQRIVAAALYGLTS